MPAQDNLHSRLVGWVKVLLPLAALVLLSTMFLFGRGSKGVPDIPFAEIEAIAREQRITAPRFAGTGRNGAAIAITATSVAPQPDTPSLFAIDTPRADIDMPSGTRVALSATAGEIDSAARTARLDGLARLTTSDGYEMEVAGLLADLDAGEIRSLGPLEVHAPFGELTAAELLVTADQDGGNSRMVFSGGVRLLYDPQP